MELLKKIAFISFLIFLFLFPFNQTWTNIFWFISVFGVLVNKDLYKNFSLAKLYKGEKYFIFFSSCYVIWCFVSLLWSDDVSRGLQLSGRYITIMLFPIFITLARIGGVIKKGEVLVWAFGAGVLVSSLACFYLSYQDCWHETGNGKVFNFDYYNRNISMEDTFSMGTNCFTYAYLSHFINPSYYSMCFIFTFVFLINKIWQRDRVSTKVLTIIGLLYCSIFIFFLQCRAELICLGVIIVLTLIFYSLIRKQYKTLIIGLLSLTIIGVIIIPHTRLFGIIDGVKKTLERGDMQDIDCMSFKENENIRLFLWKNAFEVIKQQPILGVGLGDADLVMRQQNEKNKFPIVTLGAHNQYLYCWLALGFVGLLLLFAMLFSSLYYGIKNRYFPLFGFTIALMIGIMFESMLSRGIGVMFIPWAMTLLLMMSEEKKKEIINE